MGRSCPSGPFGEAGQCVLLADGAAQDLDEYSDRDRLHPQMGVHLQANVSSTCCICRGSAAGRQSRLSHGAPRRGVPIACP